MCSRICDRVFLCLKMCTNEAKDQYEAELTLLPRLYVQPLITAGYNSYCHLRSKERGQKSDIATSIDASKMSGKSGLRVNCEHNKEQSSYLV